MLKEFKEFAMRGNVLDAVAHPARYGCGERALR